MEPQSPLAAARAKSHAPSNDGDGPAPQGSLLNGALAQAGIDPRFLYVTNAVEHFKLELGANAGMHKTAASPLTGADSPCW